jgi:hypothetical protein
VYSSSSTTNYENVLYRVFSLDSRFCLIDAAIFNEKMKVEAVEMEALKREILKGNLNIQNVLQVMTDFQFFSIISSLSFATVT